MDRPFTKSERFTAVASTIVAVLILAAGVTAHNASSPSVTPQDVTELESDLRFQINSAFRHHAPEQRGRLKQLDDTLAAWEASPQSEDDRKLLANWLRESTIRSVQGRIGDLPPTPEFGNVTIEPRADSTMESGSEMSLPDETPMQLVENREIQIAEQARIPDEITARVTDQVAAAPRTTSDEDVESDLLDLRIEPVTEVEAHREVLPQEPLNSETPSDEPVELPVSINLVELAARIAGYHDALDRVELTLLKSDKPGLSTLTDQVETVNDLARDFQFISLYYESLSAGERRSILKPRSLEATVGEITRQLDRFESVGSGDFLEPFDRDIVEQIKVLRRILAEITIRIAR